MKRILLLTAIILTISGQSYAQKQFNNWLFGDQAGLTFNTSPPMAILTGATNDWEGVASISDPSTGELLFYTNGQTVWNRNNQLMPNGTGLLGNTSSEQSALPIRSLVDTSIYYLFTVDQAGYFWPSRGFNYSIVDMRLDSGLGDVSCINIHVLDSASEALTAIPRADLKAYWIIVHKMNSNSFYAYTLSDSGLSSTAVIRNVGTPIGISNTGICGISSSPDGQHIALSVTNIPLFELFDFDPSTGIVSNSITLPSTSLGCYLSAFSSDGKFLYINDINRDSTIGQFDLSSGNSMLIANSEIMLDTVSKDDRPPVALMQAPDGKIYITNGRFEWLSTINNPNVRGPSAQLRNYGFDLETGSGLNGLPNIPSPLLGKDWLTDAQSSIVSFNTDTVGADYYLYLKVPASDHQNPVHIALSWNPNSVTYESTYSKLLVQLQPQVTASPGELDLEIDRTSFDSIIILDFRVDSIAGIITMNLDSIPISIVPGCLSVYQSQTITRSFDCGYSTLFSYLKTGQIPLAIKSIAPNPAGGEVQVSFVNPLSSSISYQVMDVLGTVRAKGSVDGDVLTLDVHSLANGLYYLRAQDEEVGAAVSGKFVVDR